MQVTKNCKLLSKTKIYGKFEVNSVMELYKYSKKETLKDLLSIDFETNLSEIVSDYKNFGFCFVSEWLDSAVKSKFKFFIIIADNESIENIIKKEDIICSLDEYKKMAKVIEENCSQKFPDLDSKFVKNCKGNIYGDIVCFVTHNKNYIIFPTENVTTFYDFLKLPKDVRKKFWNVVNICISELEGEKFQLTMHVGPCHQQGVPVFHFKVGPKVGECSVGKHPKLKSCLNNPLSKYSKDFNFNPVNIPNDLEYIF